MKNKFLKIIKEFGFTLDSYKTYRSDMGCQVYDIDVRINENRVYNFNDSYWVGSGELEKQKVTDYFRFELKRINEKS